MSWSPTTALWRRAAQRIATSASRNCGYPPTPFAGGRDVFRARRERPSTADVRPHLTPSRHVDTEVVALASRRTIGVTGMELWHLPRILTAVTQAASVIATAGG
jgi:hypothetical protein